MIGKRISRNMVVVSRITTFEEFLIQVEDNRAIYKTGLGIKPARFFANMQFHIIAYGIEAGRFYSIIHYKQLQCDPPQPKKHSSKTTKKPSPKS